jgi:hypothetical protein
MGAINSSDRMAATLCCLGTGFVSGMCINILPKVDSDDDDDDDIKYRPPDYVKSNPVFNFTSIYRLKFTVKKVNIVNPPGIVSVHGDWANVSLRTSIFHNDAVKVVVNGVGCVQAKVPKQLIT